MMVIVCIIGKVKFNFLDKGLTNKEFVLDTNDLVIIKETGSIQIEPIKNS